MTSSAQLHGARIRRLDAPTDQLIALTLATASYKGVLIVSLARNALGLGLVATRPRGQSATAFVQKLRKELEGGRIESITQPSASELELHITRGDGTKRLLFDFASEPQANLTVWNSEGSVLATLHPSAQRKSGGLRVTWPDTLEALEAAGVALLATTQDSALEAQRIALRRGLASAQKQLTRKRDDIAADAARATRSPELRAQATLLLANLGQIARGANKASLIDYAQDPPQSVEVELDPATSAREQAEQWFQRARRFERGAGIAQTRLAQVDRELHELAVVREAVEHATDTNTLLELEQQARKLGAKPRDTEAGPKARAKKRPTRLPYRKFLGHGERPILVGRGAADNDELTLHHANPHDLWLHARDTAGAHVVVPLNREESCPPQLLADAALLAAHFSSDRNEPTVDITHTPRRHISKPKGSPPGSVTVQREKVFRLQADPPRLQHLLSTEQK